MPNLMVVVRLYPLFLFTVYHARNIFNLLKMNKDPYKLQDTTCSFSFPTISSFKQSSMKPCCVCACEGVVFRKQKILIFLVRT